MYLSSCFDMKACAKRCCRRKMAEDDMCSSCFGGTKLILAWNVKSIHHLLMTSSKWSVGRSSPLWRQTVKITISDYVFKWPFAPTKDWIYPQFTRNWSLAKWCMQPGLINLDRPNRWIRFGSAEVRRLNRALVSPKQKRLLLCCLAFIGRIYIRDELGS